MFGDDNVAHVAQGDTDSVFIIAADERTALPEYIIVSKCIYLRNGFVECLCIKVVPGTCAKGWVQQRIGLVIWIGGTAEIG